MAEVTIRDVCVFAIVLIFMIPLSGKNDYLSRFRL